MTNPRISSVTMRRAFCQRFKGERECEVRLDNPAQLPFLAVTSKGATTGASIGQTEPRPLDLGQFGEPEVVARAGDRKVLTAGLNQRLLT
ncbi:hypothetical protein XH91_18265 [Bradyrhizobium guangzhouense]|uniref:Uncharacterized protein n=1 Tax=Bradyrhizobium guangzhouense TaxID=1325095 RepID=A0AAE6C8U4_9BRAD|nr:hypothetical protein XH91_18265 [Bradyrhizobium guangzhouense]